jgi:predicted GH43/DUF377 family glycosyl hydrolase/GR25 family glycosyltransferase involved in LPS biosynthesis
MFSQQDIRRISDKIKKAKEVKAPVCLVITCDQLAERKAKCIEHFREKGVRATFMRGLHGVSAGLRTVREFETGQTISSGHVALILNHYTAWQCLDLILRDSDDYGIVFEDDAVLPDNFSEEVFKVKEELFHLLPKWDLVFLGSGDAGIRTWNKITERLGGPTSRYCRQSWPWGSHALMIRKKAIPILSRLMAVAERNMDQQLYDRVLKDNHLEWCMVLPSLVQQRTYDHKSIGMPEWKPSTLDNPAEEKTQQQPFEVSREQYAATMKLIDPYECIYRGEFMEETGIGAVQEECSYCGGTGRIYGERLTLADIPEQCGMCCNGFITKNKSIVLSECARLNVPCHVRVDVNDVVLGERKVISCATCDVRSEIHRNTNVVKLPIPDGHFNPSMCLYRGEQLIVATRDSWGHSALGLWKLKNSKDDWLGEWSVEPIGSFRSSHPDAPRLEDPRLHLMDGFYAALNLPDNYPPKLVRVGTVKFKTDLSGIDEIQIYDSPFGNAYEKNWVPFLYCGMRRWIYGIKPEHIILNHNGEVVYKTDNKLPWKGGALRGGATPVLVRKPDGSRCYYHFAHGCLKTPKGNCYTIGCVVFDYEPPHRVLRQTAVPLVWPEAYHGNEAVVKRNVVFPGGAVPHNNNWFIIAGRDDTDCVLYRLPFEEVEAALTDIPEIDEVVSIRQTPVSLGVLAKERNGLFE